MHFKQLVESKYQITETEVTSGFKDMLKKAGLALTGMLMLTESALGFTFKPEKLKSYEKEMKLLTTKYEKTSGTSDDYDFKIDAKQTGGVQLVQFKVMKNGKVAGMLKFTGTTTDVLNDYEIGYSPEGRDDDWVREVLDSQQRLLEKKFKEIGGF